MLDTALLHDLLTSLGEPIHPSEVSFSPVQGGDINTCYLLEFSGTKVFAKVNDKVRYPRMFEQEAKGLRLLSAHSDFHIPKVLSVGASGDYQFLIMEYLDEGIPKPDFWETFAISLAQMHSQTQADFGLDQDNYIGSLRQSNTQHQDWPSFFVQERLDPLVRKAFDQGRIDGQVVNDFTELYGRMERLFPEESPALIHGDLWSGNFMCGSEGHATIYDPAIYYGHREMDLAMTRLFGGFAPEFYAAYHAQFPLEAGWEERVDLCNLYPLLVHVVLFGGGYVSQVRSILHRFSA